MFCTLTTPHRLGGSTASNVRKEDDREVNVSWKKGYWSAAESVLTSPFFFGEHIPFFGHDTASKSRARNGHRGCAAQRQRSSNSARVGADNAPVSTIDASGLDRFCCKQL